MLKELLGIDVGGKPTIEDAALATAEVETVAAAAVVENAPLEVVAIPARYPNGIAINLLIGWLWEQKLTLATQVSNLLTSLNEAWPTGYGDDELQSKVENWKSLGWIA